MVVGLLMYLGILNIDLRISYWITFAGAALLSLACILKGL
jgi:hypothetical protein